MKTQKYCTFCEKIIMDDNDLIFTEDAEPAHKKCLKANDAFWNDRNEIMDLMGW